MIKQCSRWSLPTGSEASDKKSENIKSCAIPMPTCNPIFVIIRWIKAQLFAQGMWTCITLQSSRCQNSAQIFLLSLQNTWNCMLLQKIAKTGLKLLNRARVACCQRAQKPRIKNPKTSNRAQCQCQPATQFLLSSVELKCNFLHKERELVLSPYKAHTAKIPLKYFYWASKIRETACYCRKSPKQPWNDWTVLALLAANRPRSLGSKIRKRQIVRNADADLRPDFCYHTLN